MLIVLFRLRYRLLIFLLLAAFLLFSFWAARRAFVQGSKVSDVDYYNKGLRYSASHAEEQAAADLGWQLTSNLSQHRLSLKLGDRNSLPVSKAAGTVTRRSPNSTADKELFLLQEGPLGTYQLSLPPDWRGETVLHLEFFLDGARFSRRLLLNLQP